MCPQHSPPLTELQSTTERPAALVNVNASDIGNVLERETLHMIELSTRTEISFHANITEQGCKIPFFVTGSNKHNVQTAVKLIAALARSRSEYLKKVRNYRMRAII